MADENKQKTVRVVTGIEKSFQPGKLVIACSDLVFDEEGRLIEVKQAYHHDVEVDAVARFG